MGKDNVPFHSVVFPCSLLGTGEDYTLVHHISTTEFLNFEGGKFSKSRNVGVFGNNVVASGIPASVWRYYLLVNRPENSDTTFLWDDFAAKCNSELLANLGNFVSRVVRFVRAKYNGVVPEFDLVEMAGSSTAQKINQQISVYLEAMEVTKLKVALKAAMAISTVGNEFLTSSKLDNSLFSGQPSVCAQVIGTAVNIVHLLGTLLYPFVPATSESIYGQLNAPVAMIPDSFEARVLGGHVIGEPEHLFVKIEEAKIEELRRLYGGVSQ
jgi:methionyl-tRNA synthetase